ncbi:RNA polymerase sigma-70 factor [Parapedobacter deserti]|uniref:RNA polymerase sigma-70 factor n=1 Tax=Parapedobacter deserti TaxID=1912957 RepID=A0ABV7JKV9_9SPHI
MTVNFNEEEALARSADGDHAAFRLIYDYYSPRVYHFALKYLKSKEQAEEIVQEVFLKLWKCGKSLSTIKDLDHYLFILSRNQAFDQLRLQKTYARHTDTFTARYDDRTNNTEETIFLGETRRILDEGVAKLPPQQKRVYQLCHQRGLKYDEAAAQLNLSPQTVHRHMKLALRFLRTYLQNHADLAVLCIVFYLFAAK